MSIELAPQSSQANDLEINLSEEDSAISKKIQSFLQKEARKDEEKTVIFKLQNAENERHLQAKIRLINQVLAQHTQDRKHPIHIKILPSPDTLKNRKLYTAAIAAIMSEKTPQAPASTHAEKDSLLVSLPSPLDSANPSADRDLLLAPVEDTDTPASRSETEEEAETATTDQSEDPNIDASESSSKELGEMLKRYQAGLVRSLQKKQQTGAVTQYEMKHDPNGNIQSIKITLANTGGYLPVVHYYPHPVHAFKVGPRMLDIGKSAQNSDSPLEQTIKFIASLTNPIETAGEYTNIPHVNGLDIGHINPAKQQAIKETILAEKRKGNIAPNYLLTKRGFPKKLRQQSTAAPTSTARPRM